MLKTRKSILKNLVMHFQSASEFCFVSLLTAKGVQRRHVRENACMAPARMVRSQLVALWRRFGRVFAEWPATGFARLHINRPITIEWVWGADGIRICKFDTLPIANTYLWGRFLHYLWFSNFRLFSFSGLKYPKGCTHPRSAWQFVFFLFRDQHRVTTSALCAFPKQCTRARVNYQTFSLSQYLALVHFCMESIYEFHGCNSMCISGHWVRMCSLLKKHWYTGKPTLM